MYSKTIQKDMNNAAWAACDGFRGLVAPTQYKDYILVMFFLKYISDVWEDHYESHQIRHGDDIERIRRKLDRERFIIPIVTLANKNTKTNEEMILDEFPATYLSLYERRAAVDIGNLINIVLCYIEEANKGKLKGVFRNVDFNSEINLGKTKERNKCLKQLLEDFYKPQLTMKPSLVLGDVIGNAYFYLIERFALDSGKKTRKFFTPLKLTELVTKLVSPKVGDCICDPVCGSGGFLLQAAKEIGERNFALFGQESSGSTWSLCRMNMFLHNFDNARIEWCDTINSPLLLENNQLMKFNCVVSNLSFSLDKWDADNAEADKYNRFWRGIPPKGKGDWAFISHMLEIALKKEGRVAVLVRNGVLFRGASEKRIRTKVVKENLLDAVIGLPGNLFPSINVPVAILIFDRSRERGGARESCEDVLFIDASRDFTAGKNQNTLSEEHVTKIIKAHAIRAEVEKYVHVAHINEIQENDFNLNIPRYIDTFEEEKRIDIGALQQEIDNLEIELTEVRVAITKKLQDI